MVCAHEDELNDIVNLRHYLTWDIDKSGCTTNSDLFDISKNYSGHHYH